MDMKKSVINRIKEKLDNVYCSQTTIRDLYGGKLFPAEMIYSGVVEYKALVKASSAVTAKINALAANDPELSEAVDAYRDSLDSMTELLSREQFAQGFALAVKMIMESL